MKTLIFLLMLAQNVFGTECRSPSVVREFNKLHGYSRNPPNTIIDHVCPLSIGGLDIIGNLQYQSYKEARAKDKWERTQKGKFLLCNSSNSLPTRTVFNCND